MLTVWNELPTPCRNVEGVMTGVVPIRPLP